MKKSFAPRIVKRSRKITSINNKLYNNLFKISDQKLLKGAVLDDITLKNIKIKAQVRTNFNDRTLEKLSDNIKLNGLIQPLVLHRKNKILTLICGERRFKAMTLIKMKQAPCFILENKTKQELMAIQFSENTSREALHYIDKAEGIKNYQQATKASERKIEIALGISKSEVHRSLTISKLSTLVKKSVKIHNIEKYVLIEYAHLTESPEKKKIERMIIHGMITKRSQFKKIIHKE